jgi:hypothetical protein
VRNLVRATAVAALVVGLLPGVAAGKDEDDETAWTSDAGVTWELLEIDAGLVGADSQFWQIASYDGVAIAGLDVDGQAVIGAVDLTE